MRSHLSLVLPLMAIATVMTLLRPGLRLDGGDDFSSSPQMSGAGPDVVGPSSAGPVVAAAQVPLAGTGGNDAAPGPGAVARSGADPERAAPSGWRDRDWRSRERDER